MTGAGGYKSIYCHFYKHTPKIIYFLVIFHLRHVVRIRGHNCKCVCVCVTHSTICCLHFELDEKLNFIV